MQDLRAGSQNDDLEQSDAVFITIYPNWVRPHPGLQSSKILGGFLKASWDMLSSSPQS